MWHNKKPVLKYLKIFGSTVYTLNKVVRRKFDEKSTKSIFFGYKPNGYKLWYVEWKKFMVASRDVVVVEINMLKSRTVHEIDSKDQSNNSDQNIDSVITDYKDSDFSLVENDGSLSSR